MNLVCISRDTTPLFAMTRNDPAETRMQLLFYQMTRVSARLIRLPKVRLELFIKREG